MYPTDALLDYARDPNAENFAPNGITVATTAHVTPRHRALSRALEMIETGRVYAARRRRRRGRPVIVRTRVFIRARSGKLYGGGGVSTSRG